MNTRQAVRPVWLLAAFLMMMDALTTYLAFTWPTGAMGVAEGNPLMASAFGAVGVGGAMLLKALIGIGCAWVLAIRTDRGRFFDPVLFKSVSNDRVKQVGMYALTFTVLIMGLVVGNNLRALALLAGA